MSIYDVRARAFPYVVMPCCGGHLILNREYKPVGFHISGYVKYEDYPILVKIQGFGLAVRSKLSASGEITSLDVPVFFYNDGCIPTASKDDMEAYLAKMRIFMKLRTEPMEWPQNAKEKMGRLARHY
jgi:hypothetical protein